ncbi:hypothetical protein H4Q26_005670 [Puccinia striiformis f. sp. tritici PST-130]|nr:hypothetical protein H4Q26_005670 [Puccinia striiformis f. sp. tritici PST-130]
MIRVVINALNEGNPGLNLGEEVVNSVETGFKTMRNKMIIGSKYIRILKFELMKLFELQANLRSLSYFNFLGRLRLSLALVRVTISIPIRIDQIMRNGFDSSSSSSDEEEEEDDDQMKLIVTMTMKEKEKEKQRKKRAGILPNKITGLLEATVDILERGERATSIWNSSSPAADLSHPHQSPHSTGEESGLDNCSTPQIFLILLTIKTKINKIVPPLLLLLLLLLQLILLIFRVRNPALNLRLLLRFLTLPLLSSPQSPTPLTSSPSFFYGFRF